MLSYTGNGGKSYEWIRKFPTGTSAAPESFPYLLKGEFRSQGHKNPPRNLRRVFVYCLRRIAIYARAAASWMRVLRSLSEKAFATCEVITQDIFGSFFNKSRSATASTWMTRIS
jgi:hypothetical protein